MKETRSAQKSSFGKRSGYRPSRRLFRSSFAPIVLRGVLWSCCKVQRRDADEEMKSKESKGKYEGRRFCSGQAIYTRSIRTRGKLALTCFYTFLDDSLAQQPHTTSISCAAVHVYRNAQTSSNTSLHRPDSTAFSNSPHQQRINFSAADRQVRRGCIWKQRGV